MSLQGYITRTLVDLAEAPAVPVLTDVMDGLAHLWLDGIVHVLRAFSREGRPSKPAA